MLNILLAAATVFLLIQIFKLRKMQKHDRYLYAFTQLHRETIDYLFDSHSKISRDDYIALRNLSDALKTIIYNYKNHKTVIFNFRLFVKHLNEVKKFEEKASRISTENQEIKKLIEKAHQAIIKAFLAFTPFIRSEFFFRLIKIYIKIFALAGKKSLTSYLSSLDEAKIKRNAFSLYRQQGFLNNS